MLILLAPSETKTAGGTGTPLALDSLAFPSLNGLRAEIIEELVTLSNGPVETATECLKISQRLAPEIEFNQQIYSQPTMPAAERYTGVLYDALDVGSLPSGAWEHLYISSALFGVTAATDLIPKYRLSAQSRLRPGASPTELKRRWGNSITDALEAMDQLILDLRSGAYAALGPLHGATTVTVKTVKRDGRVAVMSHFSKHYKGLVARLVSTELATTGQDTLGATAIADVLAREGFDVEIAERKSKSKDGRRASSGASSGQDITLYVKQDHAKDA